MDISKILPPQNDIQETSSTQLKELNQSESVNVPSTLNNISIDHSLSTEIKSECKQIVSSSIELEKPKIIKEGIIKIKCFNIFKN